MPSPFILLILPGCVFIYFNNLLIETEKNAFQIMAAAGD
jgi:hypothetical protein